MIDPRAIFVVGCGAALGGIVRFCINALVVARAGVGAAPYATFFINVSGSFLIGIVLGSLQARAEISPLWRVFLATGILGGYTTFSTFSFEALGLASSGAVLASLAYSVGSVILGIGAAYLGLALARLV